MNVLCHVLKEATHIFTSIEHQRRWPEGVQDACYNLHYTCNQTNKGIVQFHHVTKHTNNNCSS